MILINSYILIIKAVTNLEYIYRGFFIWDFTLVFGWVYHINDEYFRDIEYFFNTR